MSRPESGPNGVSFSQEEVLKALYDLEGLMRRCLLNTSFLCLGDIGKAIKENSDFSGQELEFGIEKRYITPEVMSTLKSFCPLDTLFTDTGFVYKFGNVPVKVRFINRRYEFFRFPDQFVYWAGEYKIPNPFAKYLKARWIIQ